MNKFLGIPSKCVAGGVLIVSCLYAYAADAVQMSGDSGFKGTFSDICAHPETGDLLGTELSFIPTPNGFVVLFQQAEGVLLKPELLVPKANASRRVEIQQSNQGGAISFSVELKSENELVIQFKDGQITRNGTPSTTLRRRPAIWSDGQKVDNCR